MLRKLSLSGIYVCQVHAAHLFEIGMDKSYVGFKKLES